MTWFCINVLAWIVLSISAYADHGNTASGVQAQPLTGACGPSFPFGTRFHLPDGRVITCTDRGRLVTDGHLDIWVADREAAIAWGRQVQRVGVVREACQ